MLSVTLLIMEFYDVLTFLDFLIFIFIQQSHNTQQIGDLICVYYCVSVTNAITVTLFSCALTNNTHITTMVHRDGSFWFGLFVVYNFNTRIPRIVTKGLSPFSVCCLLRIGVHYVLLICILQRELN